MLDFNQIREYLPQRWPMLMVDKVLEFEKGRSLTAVKNVSANEIFFVGHFPNMAIFPGALILEGFGQSASILYQLTFGALSQDEIPLVWLGQREVLQDGGPRRSTRLRN